MITRKKIDYSSDREAKPANFYVSVYFTVLRFMDVILVGLTALVAYQIYPETVKNPLDQTYIASILLGMLVASLFLESTGVYQGNIIGPRFTTVRKIAVSLIGTFGVILFLGFAFKITEEFSRVWGVIWFMFALTTMSISHSLLQSYVREQAKRGKFASRTVIFGMTEIGAGLVKHLRQLNDYDTDIIGFIDDRLERVPDECEEVPFLGNSDSLFQLVREGHVDQVIVALPWSARERQRDVLKKLAMMPVHVRIAPDLVGMEFFTSRLTRLGGLPVLAVFDTPISGWASVVKSLEDKVLAALMLVALAPVMAVTALAIKLDSKGPVIFKQRRHGFNHKLITVWKFRTMYSDMSDANCDQQTTKDDPRVTRVGHFLRKTSLDELPQLINVLKGDMSVVGPRPHALSTKADGRPFEEVVEEYAARHKVKPGITGWAQVNGWRGETDTVEKIEKRVQYDLYYIENWSILFDLLILFKTAFLVFNDETAY